jgi:AraC family transcriptional regulator of adaptative response / DNA-3-methyladenine glycosylase II
MNAERYYQALQSRDRRFDGRFFVGVKSTGIYCRVICPARLPHFENCRFYPSAAAAQESGFRPCLRCRPELAPEAWARQGRSELVRQALQLIDSEQASGLEEVAQRLSVSSRHLRRSFQEELGARPVSVVQSRRLHLAKQLIHDTQLSMIEVALAAGFGSLRRFNETFQELYGKPPSSLRQARTQPTLRSSSLTLELGYVQPFDFASSLGYLQAHQIEGLERVESGTYFRHLPLDGWLSVTDCAKKSALQVKLWLPELRQLPGVLNRLRRMFDVDADTRAIEQHLRLDQRLEPLVAARPGLRVPGGWDGFESGVRALLGQQISLAAFRQLAAGLLKVCGSAPLFPTPQQVLAADLQELPMPGARKRALQSLAQAALDDPRLFQPGPQAAIRLQKIPGIGPWTAQCLAMHLLGESDAFPSSDAALLRSLGPPRLTPAELEELSQAWRPWRAYAAIHLWENDRTRSKHASLP